MSSTWGTIEHRGREPLQPQVENNHMSYEVSFNIPNPHDDERTQVIWVEISRYSVISEDTGAYGYTLSDTSDWTESWSYLTYESYLEARKNHAIWCMEKGSDMETDPHNWPENPADVRWGNATLIPAGPNDEGDWEDACEAFQARCAQLLPITWDSDGPQDNGIGPWTYGLSVETEWVEGDSTNRYRICSPVQIRDGVEGYYQSKLTLQEIEGAGGPLWTLTDAYQWEDSDSSVWVCFEGVAGTRWDATT